MNTELANTEPQEVTVLNGLAMQARALRMTIDMNMWELARVFVEAKELLPHGQFGKWVEENADCSERTAQSMMTAYKRFGGKPQFEGLGRAKTFKLLPLPAGTEEQFLEEHDLQAMTAREVERAVKQVREEAQAEIERERQARIDAENRPPVIPTELTDELQRYREQEKSYRTEIERLAEAGKDIIAERQRLVKENQELKQENLDQAEMLAEQQSDLTRAQQELLGMKSAIAKGDAERLPADQLTINTFASAVRGFVGTCARLPHMRIAFATMPNDEKEEYNVLLSTVEKWAADSRTALNSMLIESEVIINE